mgnify:FL=1|jgi:hypothetical protein
MIIKPKNIKVVTISDDDSYWTVVQTYVGDEEIGTQYTIINENAHRQKDGPYSITKKGLEQMFKHDVTILFDEEQI